MQGTLKTKGKAVGDKIERFYEDKKGYSRKRADYVAGAVAGKEHKEKKKERLAYA